VEFRRFHVGPDDDPDKYRLVHGVGHGGEAELWKAEVAIAGEPVPVAVKILRPSLVGEADTWHERWAEQVELLRLIPGHPAVVGVHDAFEGARMHPPGQANPQDRALFLVMNWIEGQDLREWVIQHDRPEDRVKAQRYLRQVANVLDWLHSGQALNGRPVVHGDISPANVVIDREDQAVLVDFSLARVARHVTRLGRGTPGYCAPEVRDSGEYTAASDRYAFGGLAYYVLTGTHPPEDPQRLRAGLAAIAGAGDQQTNVDRLAQIFADDPGVRPPAGDWLRALGLQTSTAPVQASPIPPLAAGSRIHGLAAGGRAGAGLPERRRSRRLAWIAAALTAALFVAIAIVLLRPTTPQEDASSPGETAEPAQEQESRTRGPSTQPSTETAQSPGPDDPTGQYAAPAGSLSLIDFRPIEEIDGGYESGAQRVNTHDYEPTLYYSSSSCLGTAIAVWQLDRQYQEFTARIGLSDDSPRHAEATFSVVVDDDLLAEDTLEVGATKDLAVDISGGFRMELRANRNGCSTSAIYPVAVWIDPAISAGSE
jgi:serine/threonine protein kinase